MTITTEKVFTTEELITISRFIIFKIFSSNYLARFFYYQVGKSQPDAEYECTVTLILAPV